MFSFSLLSNFELCNPEEKYLMSPSILGILFVNHDEIFADVIIRTVVRGTAPLKDRIVSKCLDRFILFILHMKKSF